MTALLGIDYGGTHTKLLLAGADGDPAATRRRTVPSASAAGLDGLAREVEAFLGGSSVAAFGVTVPGTLDVESGVVGHSANLPWLDGLAPATLLGERIGAPGVAVQDGVAAAIAEARSGAGRGHDDIFVVALGTGIAGAHVVRGEVRRGAHGGAGEVGHTDVGGDLPCSCGQRGCLETLIGGAQLGRRWRERLGSEGGDAASAVDVVRAARGGDAAAIAVLDDATSALARALLTISALIDPALFVIGGGLARSPEWTVDPAVAKARSGATFHRLPDVVPAGLGVWAGAQGAALSAADLVLTG
ncbi:ROK family protein [Microbacterium marinilacus]|uniref:ROK family protein n=1 Tax=Microbacterium marinilacus TaxID=415209 RepID=A0ABP7BRR2_9MICO|nr:ROK family protein [Microbacterium marinilacus]MBY0689130.1 ROK family protein [Microbacterium marinilacus]